MLTLVRDTYRAGDEPVSSSACGMRRAFRRQPGHHRPSAGPGAARPAMVARSRLGSCRPRIIATWLGAALAAGIAWGIVLQPVDGLAAGIALGLAAGIALGLAAGIVFGHGNKIPKRIAPVRWRQLFRRGPLVAGLLAGIVTVFEISPVNIMAGVVVGARSGLWPGSEPGWSPECPGQELTAPVSLARSLHGTAIRRSGS
jgi:hypothetical protein